MATDSHLRDFPTCVYVIGPVGDSDGPVKIGLAKDAETRLATLQTGNPTKLTVIDWVPGDRETERALHSAFAPWRVDREWYSRRDIVRHFFDALREHMLDRAEDAMGPDWTPSHPGLDEHYYADCATPADVAAVFVSVKRFFDFIWAGGDPEDYEDPDDDDALVPV
jgi:hypothetical protein